MFIFKPILQKLPYLLFINLQAFILFIKKVTVLESFLV